MAFGFFLLIVGEGGNSRSPALSAMPAAAVSVSEQTVARSLIYLFPRPRTCRGAE